jgi:putative transposase
MGQNKRSYRRPEQWQEHLKQQQKSGKSVAAYCREHKLTPSNFYLQRKRANKTSAKESCQFIQLKPRTIATQGVSITTPGGYRLEMDAGTSVRYIGSLLSVLSA